MHQNRPIKVLYMYVRPFPGKRQLKGSADETDKAAESLKKGQTVSGNSNNNKPDRSPLKIQPQENRTLLRT